MVLIVVTVLMCCFYKHLPALCLPDRGVVVGTSLSKYLLEKSRVVFQVRVEQSWRDIVHRYCKIYILF